MASLEQIIDYFKRQKGAGTAQAGMVSMPPFSPPPVIPTSSFDINKSTAPVPVAGRVPAPPMPPEMDFSLKSVAPAPGLDLDSLLSGRTVNDAPPEPAPMAPSAPPMRPAAPPPSPAATAADAMLKTDAAPEAGFDWKGTGRTVGQALAGMADAMTARSGGKSSFLPSAMAASTGAEVAIKAQADEDPTSPQSQFAQATLAKFTGKKPAELKTVSYAKAAKIMPMIEKLYEAEQRGKDSAADRSFKERELGLKERELGLKAGENKGTSAIPGFRSTGQVTIDDTEAKKLREGVAEFQTFKRGMDEYRRMIEANGTTEVFDRATLAKMRAISKNLQLKVKNLAQLGVLSASDIPFIEKQIPDPGLFKTASGMKGALDATDQMMSGALRDRLAVSGFAPEPEMEKLLGGGFGSPAGGSKPKTIRQNGYTYTLNEATGQYE